ncbi:MAG: hypothetical protein MR959_09965 [Selenomonas bovis]|nr:hypothetical protein [Selenomonas bovis]
MNRREFLKVTGMDRTIEDLKRVCPEADWQSGEMLNGFSDSRLAAWVNGQ